MPPSSPIATIILPSPTAWRPGHRRCLTDLVQVVPPSPVQWTSSPRSSTTIPSFSVQNLTSVMFRVESGITDMDHVAPPSSVVPNAAMYFAIPRLAPPPANPTVGERKCAAFNRHGSCRGSPPTLASTLQRPSGFQLLPPSLLRRCVAWGESSNSSPFCGLRNHTPREVPVTVDSSAQVVPLVVPRILPRLVIAQPCVASRKNTSDSSSSVVSCGSPPSCTCHLVPPSVVNRMVDLSPTAQQVSGPTQATAFRLMSLLNGTGSQIALNFAAAAAPAGLTGCLAGGTCAVAIATARTEHAIVDWIFIAPPSTGMGEAGPRAAGLPAQGSLLPASDSDRTNCLRPP